MFAFMPTLGLLGIAAVFRGFTSVGTVVGYAMIVVSCQSLSKHPSAANGSHLLRRITGCHKVTFRGPHVRVQKHGHLSSCSSTGTAARHHRWWHCGLVLVRTRLLMCRYLARSTPHGTPKPAHPLCWGLHQVLWRQLQHCLCGSWCQRLWTSQRHSLGVSSCLGMLSRCCVAVDASCCWPSPLPS